MSVPLDRLYNFLHDLCDQDVLIYRWSPHGSRKLEDCLPIVDPLLMSTIEQYTSLYMICHDQEPVNFQDFGNRIIDFNGVKFSNLRQLIKAPFNIYDKILLAHSEKNSAEITRFVANGVIDVYYWCHAIIARDWFRYAEHDPMLNQKRITKDFLIYNRAWAGTREYRLKFAEIIVQNDLVHCCQMGFNPTESAQHYTQHTFKNSNFKINSADLQSHFFLNNTESSASADYVAQDYQETGIEVVLETLFDDVRWHLTEKALRPIACGQPFVLAATAGSLEYVRSYGFETFNGLIDEAYDTVADPVKRLHCIAAEMKRISQLSPEQKLQLWPQLQAIADSNKRRFFSEEFWTQVVSEYTTNLQAGIELMEHNRTGNLFNFCKTLKTLAIGSDQIDQICSKIK
jgi:hypothetical protein